MSLIKAKGAFPTRSEGNERGERSQAAAPSVFLLLYSCAIWFTGFCSMFRLHYLNSTVGAGGRRACFHIYLAAPSEREMIVSGKMPANNPFFLTHFEMLRVEIIIQRRFFFAALQNAI